MRFKELYILEVERRMADLGETYEQAGERAYDSARERLADRADAEKQRLKDEGKWPPKT